MNHSTIFPFSAFRTVVWAVAYITGHIFHPGFRFLFNHYVERTLSVLIFYRREIRHSTLWLYSEPGKAWPDCTQLMVVLLQKRSMPCNNDTQWLFHNTWEESHELSEFDLDILDTLLDDISIYFFYQLIMICHIKVLFPLQIRCIPTDFSPLPGIIQTCGLIGPRCSDLT